MRCPFCMHAETMVKDSRLTEDGVTVRRRRRCENCQSRFTTFERVQLRNISVRKRNGQSEPYDRDKLLRALRTAIAKAPVDPAKVERAADDITRRIEQAGDGQVPSILIAEMMLDALSALDACAYIRACSIHRQFDRPHQFSRLAENLIRDTIVSQATER